MYRCNDDNDDNANLMKRDIRRLSSCYAPLILAAIAVLILVSTFTLGITWHHVPYSIASASVPVLGASSFSSKAKSAFTQKLSCSNTDDAPSNAWNHWGGDSSNSRAVQAVSINTNNVANLVESWGFEMRSGSTGGPSCTAENCYVADNAGWLYKVNARTGVLVWNVSMGAYGNPNARSRNTPIIYKGKVLVGDRSIGSGRLYAFSDSTGALLWTTVISTHHAGVLTASGTPACGQWIVSTSSIEESFAIDSSYPCCSFIGSVNAVDVETGAITWTTYTLPQGQGYSGGAVWGSSPAIDYKRRRVYVATGNLYKAPDDVQACVDHNIDENLPLDSCFAPSVFAQLHFNSIVSLDLDTGAIVWGRNLGGYDVWTASCIFRDSFGYPVSNSSCPRDAGDDWDFGQAPILYTSAAGTDLVAAGQKSGSVWALSADTGAIVWANLTGLGSVGGGYMFGSAVDSARFISVDGNALYRYWTDNSTRCGSSIAAHDRNTGHLLWRAPHPTQPPPSICQTANSMADPFPFLLSTFRPFNPTGISNYQQSGPVSISAASQPDRAVVFGQDSYGVVFALSAKTGQLLWQHQFSNEAALSNVIITGSRIVFATGPAADTVMGPGKMLHSFVLPA